MASNRGAVAAMDRLDGLSFGGVVLKISWVMILFVVLWIFLVGKEL